MIRPATHILFALSVVSGGVLFGVAFEVSSFEERLFELNKQITDDRDAIHVLRAEWSYLNQPERLEGLSHRYLELQPLDGGQIAVIAAVPGQPEAPAVPEEAAPIEAQPPEAHLASTRAARPKAKPPAPPPPARHVHLAAEKVPPRATPATDRDAAETAALDAALQAILGISASPAGGVRR